MAISEVTPLKNQPEEEVGYEEEYEEEEQWSKPVLYALWGTGTVLCFVFVYLFAFYLPSHFIPEARPLEGILKVKELDSELKILSPERVEALGLSHFQLINDDDKDEDEGLQLIEIEIDGVEELDGGDAVVASGRKGGFERFVLIGDIHGEFTNLKKLMKKISFSRKTDKVIFLGDFITKGPESIPVLEWAIENNVDCVLGNHEYYVLQNYAQFHNLYSPFFVDTHTNREEGDKLFNSFSGFNDDPEFLLAKKLQPRHVDFINSCSVIKKLGKVPFHNPEINNGSKHAVEGIAVHAGVRWDLLKDLNEQNPMDNLEMRKLLPPFFNETTDDPHVDGAVAWPKIYKKNQVDLPLDKKLVVYYGHDARKGLRLNKYTKGLDSRCNAGGHLTAMVIWKESELIDGKHKIVYKEQPFQVAC